MQPTAQAVGVRREMERAPGGPKDLLRNGRHSLCLDCLNLVARRSPPRTDFRALGTIRLFHTFKLHSCDG